MATHVFCDSLRPRRHFDAGLCTIRPIQFAFDCGRKLHQTSIPDQQGLGLFQIKDSSQSFSLRELF